MMETVRYIQSSHREDHILFKQNFKSDEGRSYADNVLFDKMDTPDQAYRDAEKQLSIPGLEAPERKRLVPPLAVGLSEFVYASSQEDK